jgi:hypothetical protein
MRIVFFKKEFDSLNTLRSGGAVTLILLRAGANFSISYCILSVVPGNMVEPPEEKIKIICKQINKEGKNISREENKHTR